jgi:hypothetical protein
MTCPPQSQPRIPVSPTALKADGSLDVFADYDPQLRASRASVSAAAKGRGALDPLTGELVRLRNAELQGCNY